MKVVCPNGCDSAQLDRQSGGGFRVRGIYYPPEVEYRCRVCDWHAKWLEESGLQVRFQGVGRDL